MARDHVGQDGLLLASAPLRADITGGFTDVPPFSEGRQSTHINMALDLRVHVMAWHADDASFHVSFRGIEPCAEAPAKDGRDRLVGALRHATGWRPGDRGVELVVDSPVPAGSGLGSSGSILVAGYALGEMMRGQAASPRECAIGAVRAASHAGIVGGKQDEFAAAFGGMRTYVFSDSDAATPATPEESVVRELEATTLLARTSRRGRDINVVSAIMASAARGNARTLRALDQLEDLACRMAQAIQKGHTPGLGEFIARIRDAQLGLHEMIIDRRTLNMMETMRCLFPGTEYKLTGGGGQGGTLLVFVPRDERAKCEAYLRRNCERVDGVRVDGCGVQATHPVATKAVSR